MRLTRGVYLVMLLLALVFNSICLGMMAKLTDCAYNQYLTAEISSSCDKQYSYNNVRVWSCVYLPHDLISFTLVEGMLVVLLFRDKRSDKPLLLTLTATACILATFGAQIHGLSRHGLGDEDYTNFSEAFASFCILDVVCVVLVALWVVFAREDGQRAERDSRYGHRRNYPIDDDIGRDALVDAPPAYEPVPAEEPGVDPSSVSVAAP